MRESPAIEICHLLQAAGAEVWAHEPFKPDAQVPGVKTAAVLGEILDEADALLLLVGHSKLRELDPVELAQLTKARVAVDCVNAWDEKNWTHNGFHVYRLGVGF